MPDFRSNTASPCITPDPSKTARVFDTTQGRAPLTYIEGNHEVVPGFEVAVLSMEPGEEKTVRLAPKDAYGEHDPHLLYVMPTIDIPHYEDLVPGQLIYLMNDEGLSATHPRHPR